MTQESGKNETQTFELPSYSQMKRLFTFTCFLEEFDDGTWYAGWNTVLKSWVDKGAKTSIIFPPG